MGKNLKKKSDSFSNELKHIRNEAEEKLALKRKKTIAIITFIIGIGIMFWLSAIVTQSLMSSLNSEGGLRSAASNFQKLIASYGNKGFLVAFSIQVIQIVVSPIPGEVIETGMGLCFGWFWGAFICLAGGALAAAIIMLFVKKYGIKFVELFVSTDKINQLRFINNPKKLKRTVFLLYLIPGTPKDPLIFFFGLTKISVMDFVVIQTIARVPSIVSSTVGGEFLVNENYLGAILIYAITGALALIGLIFYNKILKMLSDKKEHKAHKTDSQE